MMITKPSLSYSVLIWESWLKDLFSAIDGIINLSSQFDFKVPVINTALICVNLIRYSVSVIYNGFPTDFRNLCDSDKFKMTIPQWKPVDCPCRLCKIYLGGFGFINVSS